MRKQGLSFAEIAKRLGVAYSTARRWTRTVHLSEGELDRLKQRAAYGRTKGNAVVAERAANQRREGRLAGYRRARSEDALHIAGCLLYWAEGTKSRNAATLSNSDCDLLRLYLRFLRTCFEIPDDELTLRLHLYTSNGLSVVDVEEYWLNKLALPQECLRGHTLNRPPQVSSGQKLNKLPWGVATLAVLRSTWLVQHIYGAIEYYGDCERSVQPAFYERGHWTAGLPPLTQV